MSQEEQQQLENNDEAASDPTGGAGSKHLADTHSSGKLGSESELEESLQEPQQPIRKDEVAAPAGSTTAPAAIPMECRQDLPTLGNVHRR